MVARRHQEDGFGLIGTSAGVAAFLLFLLAATQLAVNLYAASTVTAAGYDSARAVAARTVDHDDPRAVAEAQVRADARFRRLVGKAADDAVLTWAVDDESVTLHVVVDPPGLLPRSLGLRVGMDRVERTFVVRIEEAT